MHARTLLAPLAVLVFTGCSTYALPKYSASADTVAKLRTLRPAKVSVGPISGDKAAVRSITCRGVGPVQPPEGMSFGDYVRGAIRSELVLAELYDEASPVRIDGTISNGAHTGLGSVSRSRSSGWTAMSAPVCSATAALSPIWSQCPCVDTMSLSVQSRAASSSAIQARHGVAVSMAIASRERASARTWTFVAIGPMTRCNRSIAIESGRTADRAYDDRRRWSDADAAFLQAHSMG